MQVKIESFSDLKQTDRGPSAKIMASGKSYYVNTDPTNLIGKTVEITVTEKTSAKGNKYAIATIDRVVESAASNGHSGAVSWSEYEQMARLAHALAAALEPNVESVLDPDDGKLAHPEIDRSPARAAILNTVMIAFSNGKVALPEEEPTPFD